MYVYIRFKTFFYVVRHLDSTASYLPTVLHLGFFRSWPSLFLPSSFFFGLPRALFCYGIHFNAILGSLSSAILWTWPYHVSWFCSISFIIVSSSPICCLTVTFLSDLKQNRRFPIDFQYQTKHKFALISGFHRAFLKSVAFIGRLMHLTLILLTWRIWWAPNIASKWQVGFNSVLKG